MIRFFRQIRKSLYSAGATQKYLVYAVGEILLVMIGILLALQVNNWNQKRLDRQEEKVIIINLKDDYQNAIKEFEHLNALRSRIVSAAKKIFSILPSEIDQYPTSYMDSLVTRTLTGPTFNNKMGSLDVLLNSGKINLITNQELKKKLIAWPGDVSDMTEDEVSHNELYLGKYCDLLETYLSWNDLAKNYDHSVIRFNRISGLEMPGHPAVSSDYRSLLANKQFLNILNRRATYCLLSNVETETLIENAKEIIRLIDNELEI